MFRKKLYIIGYGGLAREVYQIFIKDWIRFKKFAGFLIDDHTFCDYKRVFYLPIKKLSKNDSVIIAIGDPNIKKRIAEKYNFVKYSSLIDESVILNNVEIGDGSIIFPYVVFTENNTIGKHVTIYQHCSISHDTVVGNYCNITPGVHIAGRCKIGNCVYLGIGSSISNDVNICDNVTIGAGAVVVDNISEPGTYVGVPARKIK